MELFLRLTLMVATSELNLMSLGRLRLPGEEKNLLTAGRKNSLPQFAAVLNIPGLLISFAVTGAQFYRDS